jgi:hypothetical protein
LRAREEWATEAGRVHDDEPLYEERTTAFLEWFALERRGSDGRRASDRFLTEAPVEGLEAAWARALGTTHRSLFEVGAMEEGAIWLEDLLGGARFLVTERRRIPGVATGELFEARLVADVAAPPAVLFSRAFQFHPPDVADELRHHAQKARAAGETPSVTLFRLARLRLRALRYKHVAAQKIYAQDDATP